RLSLVQDRVQVRLVLETLRIDLVNVLRSGRTRGKPAACRDNFQAADGSVISGSSRQLGSDRLSREARLLDVLAGQPFQSCLLLRRGSGVDASVVRRTESLRESVIVFGGILTSAGSHFGPQQIHDEAIFICRPNGAIATEETGPGTFF